MKTMKCLTCTNKKVVPDETKHVVCERCMEEMVFAHAGKEVWNGKRMVIIK